MNQKQILYEILECVFSKNLSVDSIRLCSGASWCDIFDFFNNHSVAPLVYSNVAAFIPKDFISLKSKWKESVYSSVYTYSRLTKQQDQLLTAFNEQKCPVVVVKGTSAARYYPNPQLRTMGDIDLLVKPEDYLRAVQCLTDIGYHETTSQFDAERGRHRTFCNNNNTSVELHHFFSSKYIDQKSATILDQMLFSAISGSNTVLPDAENGIVLLAHIAQHVKNGIGLRQIIDWMMFVRSYLNDEMWNNSFQKMARLTGLEELAIITTKMCQKYMGLRNDDITWCQDADEEICESLMDYVMKCGNFGRSRELLQSQVIEKLPQPSHPIFFYKYLQSHGEENWNALKSYPWLRPFAWVYQSCRCIKIAFQNKVTPNKLKSIYNEGNKRNEMFAALGLK